MFCCRPYSVVRCCSRGADVNVAQRVTTVSVLRHFSVAIVTEWLIFCESVANERYDHNDVTWLCSVGLEEMHCSACSLAVHPGSGLVPGCIPPDGWWFRWNTNWTIRISLGVTRMDIGQDQDEYIRGTAQVGRFGEKVREARLRWFGHVLNWRKMLGILGDGCWQWSCQERGNGGKRRFMDAIRENMIAVEVTEEDAEERTEWRWKFHCGDP